MMNKFGIGRFRAALAAFVLCAAAAAAYAQDPVTPAPSAGALGTYYNNPNPSAVPAAPAPGSPITPTTVVAVRVVQEIDPTINYTDLEGRNNAAVNKDFYQVTWLGTITLPQTGSYKFRTITDDGGRLWIGTTLPLSATPVIPAAGQADSWVDQAPTAHDSAATVSYNAGQVLYFRMEMYEHGGGSAAELFWALPSAPAAFVPIPAYNTTNPNAGLQTPAPPAAPTLTATPVPGTQNITLTWTTPTPSATPASAYLIWRDTSTAVRPMTRAGGKLLGMTTATTFTDTGLAFGSTYYYIVQPIYSEYTVDMKGDVEGFPSNEVSCGPNPFADSPTTLSVIENGGIGQFTITSSIAIPAGVQVTFPITVNNVTSPGTPCFNVTGGGAGPAITINAVMTGNNTAGQSMVITITGIDDQVAANPFTASITVGPTTCADGRFNADVLPPITCTQIESDIPGIIVNPTSGLAITNGGTAITFQVKLATKPSAAVTLNLTSTIPYSAQISPTQLTYDNTTWDTFQTVTITPNNVDTTQLYVAPFYIYFTPVQSTDNNYNGIQPGTVYIFEETATPPLKKVWSKCGLTGLEGLALLAALAAWRRRRRA